MSGTHYIALSGLRARVDELDRLATDIANVGTSGYKGERQAHAAAERGAFNDALQTAIDTTMGGRRLDMKAGAIAATGRTLDVAIDGPGFFVVQTPGGPRYTRNGHFTRNSAGQLTTEDGNAVLGDGGPITLGDGEIRVEEDGSVWTGATQAGKLQVVTVDNPGSMIQEGTTLLGANGQTATPLENPVVRAGSLEQSNVMVSERLAQLTSVLRGFEALQKAISLMMNDVDGRAIDSLGRKA
jgi:flagellar basal-body rod protein FlgF